MSIFKNKIDLDNGIIYSVKGTRQIAKNTDGHGYHYCTIKDIYGNVYESVHEVIFAEGSNLPKHLWPTDENGRRYEVDHIIPVKNGGTDAFENLRIGSKSQNQNNSTTLVNHSNARKEKKCIDQFNINGEFIRQWDSLHDAERFGFGRKEIKMCCEGIYKQHKGYIWKYAKN